jgi:hypothetical protein
LPPHATAASITHETCVPALTQLSIPTRVLFELRHQIFGRRTRGQRHALNGRFGAASRPLGERGCILVNADEPEALVNEERTAAILIELRRIGIDFETLDERLVGTALRAGELLGWLRAIPDGAGPVELLRRVEEYGQRNLGRPVQVRWREEPARPAHRYERERWWPTQALLDAGTDLLVDEWDPFGIRLAGTDRETIAMFAFHFFGPLLAPNARVDPITRTAGMIASAERDHLALKPSPESHRRYLAERLNELVAQYPVPQQFLPSQSHVVLVPAREPDAPPPLDPEGVCARCHRFGTVARVTTLEAPAGRTKRYCASCWKEVRAHERQFWRAPETAAEHVAWMDRHGQPPTATLSRSWEDTLELIEMATAPQARDADLPERNRAAHLARFAREILSSEDKMDGPMPPEVAAFVQRYATPDA